MITLILRKALRIPLEQRIMSLERQCLQAFIRGDKRDAERLLPQIGQPATIATYWWILTHVTVNVNGIKIDIDHQSSLLHLAAVHGWMDVVIDLITNYKSIANYRNYKEVTPLHYASRAGHLEVVRYLINEHNCDPMAKDDEGWTPLHYACRYGHFNIVQYLINEQHCDPMTKDKLGDTVTPLHYACQYGHLNIAQYLINEQHCDPMTKDDGGWAPLHYACRYGHLNIAQYLINEHHCDPMTKDKFGQTSLHYACQYGHLNIAQYLINEHNCDPMAKDDEGSTPLHYACRYGHFNIAQYLINEQHCDPMTTNTSYRRTPLHYACIFCPTHIVQYLLSTGKVDPLAKDYDGKTPMYYAAENGNYDLLKLFRSFPQFKREFPVHTYTKLVLTGYSGAGKSTISQLIQLLANETGLFSALSSGRVTNVECLTAGIIPLHVESKVKEVGNMVIYDFAGQQEYYSSHAAVLERIMRNTAAIFACIVDLSSVWRMISESITTG